MAKVNNKTMQAKNINSPFSELFSLLTRYEIAGKGAVTLAYNTSELKVMNQHLNNAKAILSQGLEELFHFFGLLAQESGKMLPKLSSAWIFFGAMMNLTEALDALQENTDYVLRQRRG